MKIGAITIGQAPRVDVTCDIMDIFGGTGQKTLYQECAG